MRRLLLVVLLVPGAFFVLPAGVSAACSCAVTSRAQATADADVVFKGTVTGMADPEGGGNVISSGRDVFYTFDVDEVVKGVTDNPAQVVTAADGATCGADFAVGRRYIVFAADDGERLTSTLCAGNEMLPALPVGGDDVQTTESPDPLRNAEERRPNPVLATVAALALAAGVVALAVARNRQRYKLDG